MIIYLFFKNLNKYYFKNIIENNKINKIKKNTYFFYFFKQNHSKFHNFYTIKNIFNHKYFNNNLIIEVIKNKIK